MRVQRRAHHRHSVALVRRAPYSLDVATCLSREMYDISLSNGSDEVREALARLAKYLRGSFA